MSLRLSEESMPKFVYMHGVHVPYDGSGVTKAEYVIKNFSTAMDVAAYTPVLGLVVGAFQFVYGIFEYLGGIAASLVGSSRLGEELRSEGLRNMVRGGLQAMPILGYVILVIHDSKDDSAPYNTKIEKYISELENF
jgi:hypothetical protein